MATSGTKKAEIQKAVDAAGEFLNRRDGGFRDVICKAKKAGILTKEEARGLGMNTLQFTAACLRLPVLGLGSKTRRAIAGAVIKNGSKNGVKLSKRLCSPATLGLAA